MAKPEGLTYQPGKRAMLKIKHQRTADCVVAGFRWYKGGKDRLVGSLLLGLYDAAGTLHHVGVCAGFKQTVRAELAEQLKPLRDRENHPWKDWADWQEVDTERRLPGATSRWNRGKDLSWEPLRIELVCEVSYDHLQGTRFRHGTHFQRWRPDKPPADYIAVMRRILALEPTNAQALWFVANDAAQSGDRAGAATLYRRLLERLPANAPLRPQVQRQLEAVQGG